ncbi:glycoside hydrolase family 15 protein [Chelatococcus asaccharovorans]|uniref:glucan 1,4-alpha-glucosidase n=1 Tax=Chelatococcus asaccharovorans TaxID=28210 RepID=A0A2V3TV53_9HYPH|nr:glycoside hydrolase family 15 protein [Chelatococcus asaccharovorans]MBS7706074.1 hypothetical protein [Chelatococcus asaccharovorans]PXW52443.1 glucoamylase [Chelatococcus asaccharovorans]
MMSDAQRPAGAGHSPPQLSLDAWIAQEYRFAAAMLPRVVSADDRVWERRAFGQRITPAKGSVIAALTFGSYDPDPDYTFHWLRDSALVMDAVRILAEDRLLGGGGEAMFADFVTFSLGLNALSGPRFLATAGDFRRKIDPAFLHYVRSDAELTALVGDRVLGDVRFNPDGTLDIIRWGRPQNDGPALRALTVLRWLRMAGEHHRGEAAQALLAADLDYVAKSCTTPCFDLWEEKFGLHYYTELVQCSALEHGATWAADHGDTERAARYHSAAITLLAALDTHWSDALGFYASRQEVDQDAPEKALDIATILAVLHADRPAGAHSVLDPHVQATLFKVEALFAAELAINADGPGRTAPAIGRYKGDIYYGGGAFYLATLGVAEFYFRLAAAVRTGSSFAIDRYNEPFMTRIVGHGLLGQARWPANEPERERGAAAIAARGDAFMATVRHFTPPSGELSEQFDRATGAQTSAKDLGWSYAAFLTAIAARKKAAQSLDRGAADG